MSDMLDIEVEIIVGRLREDCVLIDGVKFADVMVNFLSQNVFIILDFTHHCVINQNQYSASFISALGLQT